MVIKRFIHDIVIWLVNVPLAWVTGKCTFHLCIILSSIFQKSIELLKLNHPQFVCKARQILPGVTDQVGRRYLAQLPILFFERMKFPGIVSEKGIDRYVTVHGEEHLKQVLSEKKGAIIACSHFGPFELGYLFLARIGYPVHVLRAVTDGSDSVQNPRLKYQILKTRMKIIQKTLVSFIFYKPDISFSSRFEQIFSKNELLLIWPEGSRGAHFMPIPFLTGKLHLSTGYAYLSWKYDVPVIPFFCVRKNLKYHLFFEEPQYPEKAQDISIEKTVSHFAFLLQKYVTAYPEQWTLLQHLNIENCDVDGLHIYNPGDRTETFYDLEDFK